MLVGTGGGHPCVRRAPSNSSVLRLREISVGLEALAAEDLTVYKFDYTAVDEKREARFISLKRLVGERGFEPPTPWSRTRCSTRLSHSPTLSRTRKGMRRALNVNRSLT